MTNGRYSEEPFLDSLRRQAEAKRKEYHNLLHQQSRISLSLERAKAYIQSLNSILEAEGQPRVQLREAGQTNTVGKPGNRGKDMPLRRVEWEGWTLVEIVESILDQTPDPIHVDQIIPLIYEIDKTGDKKKAKQSLVSTIRRGAEDGKWASLGRNIYQGKQSSQQAQEILQNQ